MKMRPCRISSSSARTLRDFRVAGQRRIGTIPAASIGGSSASSASNLPLMRSPERLAQRLANAAPATSIVSHVLSVCASDGNQASNCEGGG